MNWIEILLDAAFGYVVAGAIFAVCFLLAGIEKIDEEAHGISWKTKALFFPGSVALWPVLFYKWLKISFLNSKNE